MPIYFAIMTFAPNMTDYLVETFGWDFMQVLWDLLDALFGIFNFAIPNPDMWDGVWELLFT